jgi:hypothetical protein
MKDWARLPRPTLVQNFDRHASSIISASFFSFIMTTNSSCKIFYKRNVPCQLHSHLHIVSSDLRDLK